MIKYIQEAGIAAALLAALIGAVLTNENQRKVAVCDFKLSMVQQLNGLISENKIFVETKIGPNICYIDTKRNGLVNFFYRSPQIPVTDEELLQEFEENLETLRRQQTSIRGSIDTYRISSLMGSINPAVFSGATTLDRFFNKEKFQMSNLFISYFITDYFTESENYIGCNTEANWHLLEEKYAKITNGLITSLDSCFNENTDFFLLKIFVQSIAIFFITYLLINFFLNYLQRFLGVYDSRSSTVQSPESSGKSNSSHRPPEHPQTRDHADDEGKKRHIFM